MVRLVQFVLLLIGALIAIAQAQSPSAGPVAVTVPVYATVASLPTAPANGTVAYAANCRAIANAGGLNAALTPQAAGAGTGCLASFTTNGNVWQIAGTATTAQQ